ALFRPENARSGPLAPSRRCAYAARRGAGSRSRADRFLVSTPVFFYPGAARALATQAAIYSCSRHPNAGAFHQCALFAVVGDTLTGGELDLTDCRQFRLSARDVRTVSAGPPP